MADDEFILNDGAAPDEPGGADAEQLPLMPDAIERTGNGRDAAGRFAGMPGPGRKHGSKTKQRLQFDRIARSYTIDIIRKFCEMAVSRDDLVGIAAGKLILDRTWPRHRLALDTLDFDVSNNGNGLLIQNIIGQVNAGQLSPDAAALMVRIAKDAASVEPAAPLNDPATNSTSDDPRVRLAEKLTRAIEARRAAAAEAQAQEPGPADS